MPYYGFWLVDGCPKFIFQRLLQLVKKRECKNGKTRESESKSTPDGASAAMLSEEDALLVALGLVDKASNYSYQ